MVCGSMECLPERLRIGRQGLSADNLDREFSKGVIARGWRGSVGCRRGAHSAEGVELAESKERARFVADSTRSKGPDSSLPDQALPLDRYAVRGLNGSIWILLVECLHLAIGSAWLATCALMRRRPFNPRTALTIQRHEPGSGRGRIRPLRRVKSATNLARSFDSASSTPSAECAPRRQSTLSAAPLA